MPNVIPHAFVPPLLAADAAPPSAGGSIYTLAPFILIFAAMWFLMIAPQRKKQKEHQKMVNSLASGDEVLTAGGIYGIVTNVKDDRIVVKIADGTKVEIARSYVQGVQKKSAAAE